MVRSVAFPGHIRLVEVRSIQFRFRSFRFVLFGVVERRKGAQDGQEKQGSLTSE